MNNSTENLVCECGCNMVDVDGQAYCAGTLAKFRLIHGYDFTLRLKAGTSLFGRPMAPPPMDRYSCT